MVQIFLVELLCTGYPLTKFIAYSIFEPFYNKMRHM